MFSFDTILSKEFILSRVSQEQLFSRYLQHTPQLGVRYTNPLPGRSKADTHPDCMYYEAGGKLLFKDWSFTPPGGNSSWDCFAVVQQYYSCSYYQALQHIANDFGLYSKGVATPAVIAYDQQVPYSKTELTKTGYTPIQVKRKEWSDGELGYWQLPDREVTVDELERARIFPVHSFWFDNWLMGYNLSMCFGYLLGLPDKWQIYQPLSRDKRYKFRQSSSSWVHGFSTLDPDAGYVICTKSNADRFYLSLLGYNTVNVLSESHQFSQQQIEQLNQYDTVALCYDSDEVGRYYSQLRAEENGWSTIEFSPEIGKDCKEVARKYGAQKVREVVDSQLKLLNICI